MFEMLAIFISNVFSEKVFPPATFNDYLIAWIAFIILIVMVYGIPALILWIIKKLRSKKKFNLHLYNGIKSILRLTTIILITILFIALSPSLIPGGIPFEIGLILSAITGAIIAFSSTNILKNFIAGIYILLTRPYRLGDFIRIDNEEGIVEEISLNHTKILRSTGSYFFIPNQMVIDSYILNFTLSYDIFKSLINLELDSTKKGEQTRYSFKLEFRKNVPLQKIKNTINEIKSKYGKLYGAPPEFYVNNILENVVFDVVLIVDLPELIFEYKSAIIKEIYSKLYE